MNKKLFLFYTLISSQLFGQSVTIMPTSPTNALVIRKNAIGLDHRNNVGLLGVGTYAGATEGYIQTHTNHPLAFATNGGGVQMILKTNGYFGIGTDDPKYLLDITKRARIRTSGNTAGIWFSKSNNNIDEGAFFGNLNDTQTGIFIGNNWRFSVSQTGVINVPNLAGTGTRNVGADANGNLVALAAPSGSTVGFSVAIPYGNPTSIPGDGTAIYLSGNIEFNVGNAWASPYFTAPTTGLYHFDIKVLWQGHASGSRGISLRKNITDLKGKLEFPGNDTPFLQELSGTIYLNANDTVNLKVSQSSGTALDIRGDFFDATIFSGFKIN